MTTLQEDKAKLSDRFPHNQTLHTVSIFDSTKLIKK